MENYGIKISDVGVDVKTATKEELLFSSARRSLKLKIPVTITITTNGSGVGSKTIPHNLSFRPAVIAFVNYAGSWSMLSATQNVTGESTYMYIDSTNLVFDVFGFNNTTYTLVYFLSETESAS